MSVGIPNPQPEKAPATYVAQASLILKALNDDTPAEQEVPDPVEDDSPEEAQMVIPRAVKTVEVMPAWVSEISPKAIRYMRDNPQRASAIVEWCARSQVSDKNETITVRLPGFSIKMRYFFLDKRNDTMTVMVSDDPVHNVNAVDLEEGADMSIKLDFRGEDVECTYVCGFKLDVNFPFKILLFLIK